MESAIAIVRRSARSTGVADGGRRHTALAVFRAHAPHHSFNTFALVVLIAGVLAVQSSRVGLVDERLTGVEEQAQIVANTLAEYATDERHALASRSATGQAAAARA